SREIVISGEGGAMANLDLLPVRPFPQIRAREQIRTDFLRGLYGRAVNREFVRGLRRVEVPATTPAGTRIVDELKRHGLAFAEFSELFDLASLDAIKAAFSRFR